MLNRVITVCSWKGGVGKTTTVQHLGVALARNGHNVLLVDLDPMNGLSTSCGIRKPEFTITDVFDGRSTLEQAAVTMKAGPRVVAADEALAGAERALQDEVARELFLKGFLESVQADFVILDTPPSLGILTLNAFAASSGVLVAIDSKFLALKGLAQVLESISKVQKKINPALQVLGVVPTMHTRTLHAKECLEEAAEYLQKHCGRRPIFPPIPHTIKFADASFQGLTVFESAPDYEGTKPYELLAKEVERWAIDGHLFEGASTSSTGAAPPPPQETAA